MESICPNCGNHDTIYVRSGGALVCRACFVTEPKEGHMTRGDRMTQPNVRICTICGNQYRIYGRSLCQECDEQVDWLGTPTFVESPPGTYYLPDEHPRRRDT